MIQCDNEVNIIALTHFSIIALNSTRISMAKKRNRLNVYSTNPDYRFEEEEQQKTTFPPAKQSLKVWIDRKKRRGKEVTLVTGFIGSDDALKDLGKLLKSKCGVGGSVKDGEVIVQGNQRDKVLEILLKEGYKAKAAGG